MSVPVSQLSIRQTITRWMREDPYWASALYILKKMIERDSKFLTLTRQFVDLEESTINFLGMKKASAKWSTSEKIMIALAAHLFNSIHKFNLSDLDRLDTENIRIALTAIKMRFAS